MEKIKKLPEIIGWCEWVSLPDLGLGAIKAKVDTGAKTSSLHAYDIRVEQLTTGKSYVFFKVHPFQDNLDIVVECKARLVEQRIITDSGGHKEERYVIRTNIEMGGEKRKIELTLTNRESMKFRMLLGRTGIGPYYIDSTQTYLLGKSAKQKKVLKEFKLLEQKSH